MARKKNKAKSKQPYFFVCLGMIAGLFFVHQGAKFYTVVSKAVNEDKAVSTVFDSTPFSQCKKQFYQGQPPRLLNEKYLANSYELCFDNFANFYSGKTKTSLYSAEYLTAQNITAGRNVDRSNEFHEESTLPTNVRSTLADYHRSGYDRGHLTPSADMPTLQSDFQSFSLANMVPQTAENNRKIWSEIEQATRQYAISNKAIYVITLPVYTELLDKQWNGDLKAIGKNNVVVPLYMAKAIYSPKTNESAVYIAPNDRSSNYFILSVDEFNQKVKMNLFPTMPDNVAKGKQTLLKLKLKGNY